MSYLEFTVLIYLIISYTSLSISGAGMASLKLDQMLNNLSLAPTGLDIDPEAI